jgi:dTMP kinase
MDARTKHATCGASTPTSTTEFWACSASRPSATRPRLTSVPNQGIPHPLQAQSLICVDEVEVLIAIEGIDGSGKGTQTLRLVNRLKAEGRSCEVLRFPQYETSFFGKEVGRYLNGEYGTLDEVSPRFSSLLYALDRFEARDAILRALDQGKIVVCDRYTGSNMAHQGARVPRNGRASLISWIRVVEEQVLQLPKPDLVLLLNTPVHESQLLVGRKDQRSYTSKSHDLHESSSDHLSSAAENFRLLACDLGWVQISSTDDTGTLRSIEDIGDEIYREVVRAAAQQ